MTECIHCSGEMMEEECLQKRLDEAEHLLRAATGNVTLLRATLKAISDYNDTLLHEDDCDARYDDEDNAECNCSKGHIEALLKRRSDDG